MCGSTWVKIGDTDVTMFFGDSGGELAVGNATYRVDNAHFPGDVPFVGDPSKVCAALAAYSKKQIIDMLVQMVNNAGEA